jgi:CheY-like chemotaxis protein
MDCSKRSKNKEILIVDDEQDILEILKMYLESLGWSVVVTASPLSAIELLLRQPFFLVITDIAMPDMDGYEFISKMKEMPVPSEIALMTGFGYNPKHTLVQINKKYKFPIFFKPFEFKNPKISKTVQDAWSTYHNLLTE